MTQKGLNTDQKSRVMMMIGLSNTLGRLIHGALADLPYLSPVALNSSRYFLCAVTHVSHPHSNMSTKETCFKIAASFFLGLPAWHFLCAHPTFTTSWLEPFMDLQCQGFAFWQRSCWLTCAVWKHWHPTWAYWCCSGLATNFFFWYPFWYYYISK